MRRLFSTFARGYPGIGLLLLRLAVGVGVIVQGTAEMLGRPSIGRAAMDALASIAGLFLLLGFWTPVAGVIVAVLELYRVFLSHPHDPSSWSPFTWPGCILMAMLGLSLALLGPGAWSVDARLFGWRRINLGDEKD